MKIAVVILNWNGVTLLEKFLKSIVTFSTTDFSDIYVADNASTDNSIAFIKQHYPNVKIIENTKNWGFAKGYNKALQKIDAEVYALVNSDIEVTKDWLQPIYRHFKNNLNTAIVQPKILDYKRKTHFEYAGAAGGFIDELGYPYCRGRIFNTLEKDNGQYNDTTAIFWASGACLFIRSEIFHKLGGFDTDYEAHQEEIDLCWRAFNAGYQTTYIGESTVYHVGGATLDNAHHKKTFLNFRNSLYNLVKNVPTKRYLGLIFKRLVLDGVAGVKFFFEGKPLHTFAIIKAHFSFYANFIKMLTKRRQLLPKKVGYYTTKSILNEYYIKGEKKFKA